MRLEPGSEAPPFSLLADDGTTVALADLTGKKVVLYFYPQDDTPTCTAQACDLRDSWAAVERTGAAVFGVSPDGVTSHQRFKRKHRLPFRLLADEDHAVAEAYGVWGEKSLFGRDYMGILRTTFVIDQGGRIAHVIPVARAKGHAAKVLAALA